MRIDPRLILDFAVIAEERSFTNAAARLRVAQPWLSARLRRLEGLLGFALLVRTTRTVSLTDRGADFLPVAREMLRASDAANALASQLRRSTSQRLRIGAAPYTKVMRDRRDLIDRFLALRSDVSVELETGWSLALLDRLAAGEIDLAFMMGAFDDRQLEGICLRHVGVALTVARDHPFASRRVVDPAMLAGRSIQVFTRSLNPVLWDDLYRPLIAADVRFVETPELAEGPPDHMTDQSIAAFFDLPEYATDTSAAIRVSVSADANVPFSLLKRRNDLSATTGAFWNLTVGKAD